MPDFHLNPTQSPTKKELKRSSIRKGSSKSAINAETIHLRLTAYQQKFQLGFPRHLKRKVIKLSQ